MNFFVQPAMQPRVPPKLPAFTLEGNGWDDYGYVTLFELRYYDLEGTPTKLGSIKILDTRRRHTTDGLKPEFKKLGATYFSLGQSLQFYENILLTFGEAKGREVLAALRDVVSSPKLAKEALKDEGFPVSLLRFSEAEKAFREAGELFGFKSKRRDFKFTFECQLKGFDDAHVVPFDFTERGPLPHRIIAFVGKNGTGKSGVLAQLAKAMSGVSRDRQSTSKFDPERPSFDRTIVISYGVLQSFKPPTAPTSSYIYCGLLQDDDRVDVGGLRARLVQSIEVINETGRTDQWESLLTRSGLLASERQLRGKTDQPVEFADEIQQLSSGHQLVVSLFADVLRNITKESLLLLDEPETYLHPNLISALMRVLDDLLVKFDSYAIVATHSPIVAQEIPAESIKIFEREGNLPRLGRLAVESFGDNLSDITSQVFRVGEDDRNYLNKLEHLTELHSYEELEHFFRSPMSLNLRLALQGMYRARRSND